MDSLWTTHYGVIPHKTVGIPNMNLNKKESLREQTL